MSDPRYAGQRGMVSATARMQRGGASGVGGLDCAATRWSRRTAARGVVGTKDSEGGIGL